MGLGWERSLTSGRRPVRVAEKRRFGTEKRVCCRCVRHEMARCAVWEQAGDRANQICGGVLALPRSTSTVCCGWMAGCGG